MAKKKLNKVAAAAIVTALIGAIGAGSFYYIYAKRVRPAQNRAEGMALLEKGQYASAFKLLSRAGFRYGADIDFLDAMYESMQHQTSFDEKWFRSAYRQLDLMLQVRTNHLPTLVKKLKMDLGLFELNSLGSEPETATRLRENADRVLLAEPGNEDAIRALALAKFMPAMQTSGGGLQTAGDAEAIVTELRELLTAHPNYPDALLYYAIASVRHRDTLIRDRAIAEGPNTDQSKAVLADLDARNQELLKIAADVATPPDRRARAFRRASQIDQLIISARLLPDPARAEPINQRRLASVAQAADIVPVESDQYVQLRIEQANTLSAQDRPEEAEQFLRETMAAKPLLWTPRMELAELLARRGRPAEAIELLSADMQPSEKLVGIEGYIFLKSAEYVPLRRAFFRLQAIAGKTGSEADIEVNKAQGEYDQALANKLNENDPRVMQVRAGLQEIRQDRTGAIETLRHALESGPSEELRLEIMRQLVMLNLAINQPGAAADMLERLANASPNPAVLLQLIDLRIRNGQKDQARQLVEALKKRMPGNPVIDAAELKLMDDPVQRKAAFAKIPDDKAQTATVKFRLAIESTDYEVARDVADRFLKANPGDPMMSIYYAEYLSRQGNDLPRAKQLIADAIAKNPEDKGLALMAKRINATTDEQRNDLTAQSIEDPYHRALVEADQARASGDMNKYVAKLTEAIAADKNNDGAATERLFLYELGAGHLDVADSFLVKLATTKRDPAVIRSHRVRILMARGKSDEALSEANQLVSQLQNFATGWIVKGEAHGQLGQHDQALAAFDTALSYQPENLEALHGAMESAERLGRQDALKRYIDMGRQSKRDEQYFSDAAFRYDLAYGNAASTIEPRRKILEAAPDVATNWLNLGQSYYAAGNAAAAKNDKAGATAVRKEGLEHYKKAIAKFPEMASFVFQAAEISNQLEDQAGATQLIDDLEKSEKFKADWRVQLARADYYGAHGKPDVARRILETQVARPDATDDARLRLAQLQVEAGESTAALDTLKAVTRDTPAVREMRMNLLTATNRVDEAVAIADAALKGERSIPNLLLKAFTLARAGDIAGGLKLADEAVALNPEDAIARFGRARLALLERPVRNNDVITDLQVVRKNAPANMDARMTLADRLSAAGRRNEAVAELESIQREIPGSRTTVLGLINAFMEEKPPRYGRIDEILVAAKSHGLANDSRVLSAESKSALRRGDMRRAVETARLAAIADPENLNLFRDFLTTLVMAGAYQDVLTELDRIQAQNASLYWTYSTRGLALHRLKRDADAQKEFDRAISIATSLKDNAPPVAEIAAVYADEYGADAAATWLRNKLPGDMSAQGLAISLFVRQGAFDKAISAGEAALPNVGQLPPAQQATLLSDLGAAYLSAVPPRIDRAREMFDKVIAADPNNVMALNNLADVMSRPGSGATPAEAANVAKRAYEISQQTGTPNAYIMDTYGWTLIQADQVDDGVGILRQAQSVLPLPEVEYHLGEAFILQKQKDAALQSLRTAAEMIERMKQSKEVFDTSLEPRIGDALRRANEL